MRLIASLILYGIFISTAYATSLHCSEANSKIEEMVCSDSEIYKLDLDLNSAYELNSSQSKNKPNTTRDQKHWLNDVRNKCQDITCLKNVYIKRIMELTITFHSGTKECNFPPRNENSYRLVYSANGGTWKKNIPGLTGVQNGYYRFIYFPRPQFSYVDNKLFVEAWQTFGTNGSIFVGCKQINDAKIGLAQEIGKLNFRDKNGSTSLDMEIYRINPKQYTQGSEVSTYSIPISSDFINNVN